jgi:toxin ParE1/3/4
MDVIWTHRAKRRLKEIKDYIAQDQPQNAEKWIDRILERGNNLVEQPRIGRIVPEYEVKTIREVLLGDYRIIYQITPSRINILTIRHGSQLLPKKASDA